MDKLLTLPEAAKYLEVDVKTFENLIQEHRIPHYKIAGKFIRFSQQELEKFKKEFQKLKENERKRYERELNVIPNISSYRTKKFEYVNLNIKDRIIEFLKFNDFYIISFIIMLLLLYYIFIY